MVPPRVLDGVAGRFSRSKKGRKPKVSFLLRVRRAFSEAAGGKFIPLGRRKSAFFETLLKKTLPPDPGRLSLLTSDASGASGIRARGEASNSAAVFFQTRKNFVLERKRSVTHLSRHFGSICFRSKHHDDRHHRNLMYVMSNHILHQKSVAEFWIVVRLKLDIDQIIRVVDTQKMICFCHMSGEIGIKKFSVFSRQPDEAKPGHRVAFYERLGGNIERFIAHS